MQYRPHGLTGVSVSALGFGMLRLPMLADGKTVDEAQSIRMVRHAIDNGLNYMDTDYVYLGGQSELVTGKALAGGYRGRVYVTSKSPWWIMERPEDFERFFDESHRRLQTDVIDFYHIHMIMHRAWKEKVLPFKLIEKLETLKAPKRADRGRMWACCRSGCPQASWRPPRRAAPPRDGTRPQGCQGSLRQNECRSRGRQR